MRRLINEIKHVIQMDNYVSAHRSEEDFRVQRGIGLISGLAFALMSVVNIKEQSYAMLASTVIAAVVLIITYICQRLWPNPKPMRVLYLILFVVVFTIYTIEGGNDGFAALWLVIATYIVMLAIDFKVGFVISLYYLLLLILTFGGPLHFLLNYDYSQTFLLRFPFLYGINFALAVYIVIRTRKYQYELLLKQQELETLGTVDMSTGLANRNRYIQYEKAFSSAGVSTLSAIYIDVDGLHDLNNRQGHDAGDRMLRTIADLCREHFENHAVYRMGGDEFLIICENLDNAAACAAAKDLHAAVLRAGYSISYGVQTQTEAFDLYRIVRDADEKMIAFKTAYYRRRR